MSGQTFPLSFPHPPLSFPKFPSVIPAGCKRESTGSIVADGGTSKTARFPIKDVGNDRKRPVPFRSCCRAVVFRSRWPSRPPLSFPPPLCHSRSSPITNVGDRFAGMTEKEKNARTRSRRITAATYHSDFLRVNEIADGRRGQWRMNVRHATPARCRAGVRCGGATTRASSIPRSTTTRESWPRQESSD